MRRIELLYVGTDAVSELAEGAKQYGISTPLLSGTTTEMSFQFGMIGHGAMGHRRPTGTRSCCSTRTARSSWHRAYQEMYVDADELLVDL